jgi:SSS family solute:Na+ symporter
MTITSFLPLAELTPSKLLDVNWIDYLILLIYFAFVVGIGYVLKKQIHGTKDFFESGKSLPSWVCALGFIGANLGAQEVMGMAASGAKYGIMTAHFYWIGAIPAMVFVGIFMMPFYYGSKARSVPEYLRFRFDEKTCAFNAVSFAVMTIFSSGISMFALAKLLEVLIGWNFHMSIMISGVIVLAYIFMGGLTSAIYNEVIQFFLIVLGFIPLSFLAIKKVGGWSGLVTKLNEIAVTNGFQAGSYTSTWKYTDLPAHNAMGLEWMGVAMGLGFVISFGYWCTDFLVVQRAMAAESMSAARRTPIIAAIPKMLIPFIIIIPGMIALALAHTAGSGFELPKNAEGIDYNMTVPYLLAHFLPNGMLGFGLTAMMASFMSGMAGNVTAFNTVWTYDIYQSYIKKDGSDAHYLWMGKMATVFGILFSMAAAYVAAQFSNIMDMLQLIFAFVNSPLLATFLLGMFWKRANGQGAFFGLLSGTTAASIHHGLSLPVGCSWGFKGGWVVQLFGIEPLHVYPSEMAQNFWTAIWAFSTCLVVTIVVSVLTRRNKADEELVGLVYSLTEKPKEDSKSWYKHPMALGVVVLLAAAFLNALFW